MLTPMMIKMLFAVESGAPLSYMRDLQDRHVQAIDSLKDHGLVAKDTLTPRGKVLIDMLCATPLPVERWVDPREVQP